jgi:hypothetical protein
LPPNYKPAGQFLIPYGQTALPANTNLSSFWDTNTVWIPLAGGLFRGVSLSSQIRKSGQE